MLLSPPLEYLRVMGKVSFTHHIALKRLEIGFNIYHGVHDQNLYKKLPGHKIN